MAVSALPVSVVVPSWQRPDWLRNCLGHLEALSPRPELIAVVGRPDDRPTRAVVAEFPGVRWIPVAQEGFVAPIRAAVDVIQTEFVAIIDDDAEPAHADWLSCLFEAFDDETACVGSRVIEDLASERVVTSLSGRITWYGRIVGNVGGRSDSNPVTVDALPEGNWIWRTTVLRSLTISSIFDAGDASMYGCDLCLQAQRKGWQTVFTSAAPVNHFSAPRGDSSGISRQDVRRRAYSYSRNVTFIALRHFRLRLVLFVPWTILVGDSGMPGVAVVLRDLVRRRFRLGLFMSSIAGRGAGFRHWATSSK